MQMNTLKNKYHSLKIVWLYFCDFVQKRNVDKTYDLFSKD